MLNTIYVMLLIILILLGYLLFQAEYQVAKKYYPDMTMLEYVLINEKLRITPKGE